MAIKSLSTIRRNYGKQTLDEKHIKSNPLAQFKIWFAEVAKEEQDPTAMVLSTVDEQGYPDSRVILLKGIEQGGFVFFTNYDSTKGVQLQKNPHAALNFYWPSMVRQIRVRGHVKRVSRRQSAQYFASRPYTSQISAHASPQSQTITSRAYLEELFNNTLSHYDQQSPPCPQNWGGYLLIPDEMEFWQGRDDRLHDRIHYFKQNRVWKRRRLAP